MKGMIGSLAMPLSGQVLWLGNSPLSLA